MGAAPAGKVVPAPPPTLGRPPVAGGAALRNVAGVVEEPIAQPPVRPAPRVPAVPAVPPATGLPTVRRVAARAGRATGNLLASAVLGAAFTTAVAGVLVALACTAWIVGVGVTVRAATLRLAARLAVVDRRRIARGTGVRVEPVPLPRTDPGTSFRERQHAWARATALWRLVAYQPARLVLACVLVFGALVWWWVTVDCLVLAAGPTGPVPLLAWSLGPYDVTPSVTALLVVAGVAGIAAWPLAAAGATAADVALGRWLLAPSEASRLTSEVSRLSEARSLAVESAAAERRRIERDLHDGLQPQLVNLALDLGLATTRLQADPSAAAELVTRAHGEAKQAATDLRNLVRGIHPSVLDERGLDAALSALVASSGVPTTVRVDLPVRPPPGPESTAYFVVAEAVTNVTRHARARRAAVTIGTDGPDGPLRVVVEDDGVGGAHVEPGGGLAGLAARVAAVDGTLAVTSPAGGPTRVEAVIPCGR